jgi:VWFA-related protein
MIHAVVLCSTLTAWLAQAPQVPSVSAEAQVVHLEVVVTDARGRAVSGLTAADFLVFEDEVRVPVVAFRPPARPPKGAVSRSPATSAQDATPTPLALENPVTYVVYVDNPNLTPAGRRRLLRGLSPFLTAQLSTGRARVLVLAEDRGLRPLTSLTLEAQAVSDALVRAEQAPVHGHLKLLDERSTIDAVKSVIETIAQPCIEALPLFQQIVRQHAREREQHLERTLVRIEQLGVALGSIPGEKVLLFLSDGFDQRPGLHLFDQLGEICPDARVAPSLMAPALEFDLARALQRMAARANAARVTIYPLDGEGLRGHSLADVSHADRRYTPSPANDWIRESNRRSGTWIMANETGGQAVTNTNDPAAALGQLADHLAERYVLGFSPAHDAEGATHKIRVALGPKGLRARTRRSYHHGPSSDGAPERTLAALLFGLEEDGLGAKVELRAGATQDAPGPHADRVHVLVPLASLTPASSAGEPHARVRLVLAVPRDTESDAGQAELREKWIDVPLAAESGAAEPPATRELVVELPPGRAREVGVGVVDAGSLRATFKRVRQE